MKTRIALTSPDDVDATVTITMTLGRWKELRSQLPDKAHYSSPADKLSGLIRDLIEKASKHFEGASEPHT